MGVECRLLDEADAGVYAALRREMLLDSPWAFASSPGDDRAGDVEGVAAYLRGAENAIAGVFDGGTIVSVAGVRREPKAKFRHRASIWGVYTVPGARGSGHGRRAMTLAVGTARAWAGVRVIGLSVSVGSQQALGLYESLGFVVWGREPDCLRLGEASYDELHMSLRL